MSSYTLFTIDWGKPLKSSFQNQSNVMQSFLRAAYQAQPVANPATEQAEICFAKGSRIGAVLGTHKSEHMAYVDVAPGGMIVSLKNDRVDSTDWKKWSGRHFGIMLNQFSHAVYAGRDNGWIFESITPIYLNITGVRQPVEIYQTSARSKLDRSTEWDITANGRRFLRPVRP